MKLAVTHSVELRDKQVELNWGGHAISATVSQPVLRHLHSRLRWAQRKDACRLPFLGSLAVQGRLQLVWHFESDFEHMGLRRTSRSDQFFGAPLRHVEGPIRYGRVLMGGFGPQDSADERTLSFLNSIEDARFIQLQRATGADQGGRKRTLNQKLDAFYIWCAEHNKAYALVTVDYKLIRRLSRQRVCTPLVPVLSPGDLLERLRKDRLLSLRDAIAYRRSFFLALSRTYLEKERPTSFMGPSTP